MHPYSFVSHELFSDLSVSFVVVEVLQLRFVVSCCWETVSEKQRPPCDSARSLNQLVLVLLSKLLGIVRWWRASVCFAVVAALGTGCESSPVNSSLGANTIGKREAGSSLRCLSWCACVCSSGTYVVLDTIGVICFTSMSSFVVRTNRSCPLHACARRFTGRWCRFLRGPRVFPGVCCCTRAGWRLRSLASRDLSGG